MVEEGIKFFCDDQVGKLCRWLRIIGQDAVWEREIADLELIARARDEGRVILTRDTTRSPSPKASRTSLLLSGKDMNPPSLAAMHPSTPGCIISDPGVWHTTSSARIARTTS